MNCFVRCYLLRCVHTEHNATSSFCIPQIASLHHNAPIEMVNAIVKHKQANTIHNRLMVMGGATQMGSLTAYVSIARKHVRIYIYMYIWMVHVAPECPIVTQFAKCCVGSVVKFVNVWVCVRNGCSVVGMWISAKTHVWICVHITCVWCRLNSTLETRCV